MTKEKDYGFCPIMSRVGNVGNNEIHFVPCGRGCAWFKKQKTVPYFEENCAFLGCVS